MFYLICVQWAQQSIKNILEDVTNYQLAYTTHNDICSVFPGQTLLAIQVRLQSVYTEIFLIMIPCKAELKFLGNLLN